MFVLRWGFIEKLEKLKCSADAVRSVIFLNEIQRRDVKKTTRLLIMIKQLQLQTSEKASFLRKLRGFWSIWGLMEGKERLKVARDRQKSYADKRRKPLEFSVGDIQAWIPLPKFFSEVLNYFKVHISHFNPFGLAKLMTFGMMCKAYGGEPTVDLLRTFLNLIHAGNWLTLSNVGYPNVPKDVTKSITYFEGWKDPFLAQRGGLRAESEGTSSSPPVECDVYIYRCIAFDCKIKNIVALRQSPTDTNYAYLPAFKAKSTCIRVSYNSNPG
nr:hypothetical protein [Tanacetum cinerariifolium]